LQDVLLSPDQPVSGRTIFFHETKRHSIASHYVLNLTARQACSIESAALHNPNFKVFVLFSSSLHLPKAEDKRFALLNAILSYENVQLRQVNLKRYAKDTPVEQWVAKGQLLRSSFLTEHTSDLLRLLSLYRWGGIYLDTDVVVLRSLEYVPLNYVGAHDGVTLGNAVISLEARGQGHDIAELFLREFQRNFNGKLYLSNGPELMTRVVGGICGAIAVREMLDDPKRCRGLQVFNSTAFFPVHWRNWTQFFEPKLLDQTMARTKDSYMIHLWNKVSYRRSFKVGTNYAYGKYAQQHCPKTFAAAGECF
ncbi:hypothetical protein KR222_003392, partial [Zaprionus bogoriensis]